MNRGAGSIASFNDARALLDTLVCQGWQSAVVRVGDSEFLLSRDELLDRGLPVNVTAEAPGAQARGQLHRAHRGQHRRRTARFHQGRVRRLPGVPHPGARLPETALQRVRPRQTFGLQLQAPRVLPVVRRPPDVADRGRPRRRCHADPRQSDSTAAPVEKPNFAYFSPLQTRLGACAGPCLGGRAEPIVGTLKASTAQIKHGAEFARGLAEVLAAK